MYKFSKKISLQKDCIPVQQRFGEFVAGQNRPMMAMVEVTNRCNMTCPICFSDSNNATVDPSISEIRHYLLQLLEVTKTPVPIQISGGEPSVRHDLPEIIALAKRLGYYHIELITNGIMIGKRPEWLLKLKEKGLTSVYLQFDGLKKETYLKIRGQDMTEVRLKAIESLRRSSLCCTLAVVVTRGVNDAEVGDIVNFGVDNIDVVRAINFQSAARFPGRFEMGGPYDGYSLQELLKLIENQTGVAADTFRSEHIGHPDCNTMSLVFLVDGRLEPLFKYFSREDILTFLGNERRNMVLDAFAGKRAFFFRYLTNPEGWKLITKAVPIFGTNPFNVLRTKNILLFAKSFMEREGLDPDRISRCCYAITGKDGVFSFCAYNNLYRFVDQIHSQSE
jgi:uncharacterized radical SAM superfamily Fe-S cluster-containing enzyme